MAITYHAGRRIQGLSTEGISTATYSDDFSSDNWTDNDSTYIGVSGGVMNWSARRDGTNDASIHDLTSTSANWVLRFKLHVTNVNASVQAGNGFYVGLSDSIQTAGQSTSQDFIGVSIYNDNTDTYRTIDADGSALPAIYQGDSYQATTYNTGSIWYYEIIKTGSSYTVEAFSGSDYSTGSEGKITGSSSATGLRYLKVLNDMASIPTSTNPFQGTINALKFYDGVTSITSKPTNVQVGSRFEETDTRKMYHKNLDEYKVHSFTTTGQTFTVTGSGDIEYLVVGGGGGAAGGGGGAGGYLTATGHAVTAQNYAITVGSGGAGSNAGGVQGVNGSNSSIVPTSGTSIISDGGGGGGNATTGAAGGSNGGSGGGGAQWGGGTTIGGTATVGQGFAGGGNGGFNGADYPGGGGGGAGGVGGNGISNSIAGDGGAGVSSSITGSTVARAGGGGGAMNTQHQGTAGTATSGGGAGVKTGNGTAGTANTGGGGGATWSSATGGSGGSGIVIIRYLTSSSITATGGTITTIGGWQEEGT